MKIYVILDVKPAEGERRRTFEQIIESLEPEIEDDIDVLNDASLASMHTVKVLGIGQSPDKATASERQRRG